MERDIKIEKVKKNFYLTLVVFVTVLVLTYIYTRPQRVIQVMEDNQLTLNGGKKVSLIGIDPHNQALGSIRELVEGKEVKLHYDQMITDTSGYLRAYLYLTDGTFINAEVIKRGYARVDTNFPFKYSSEFTRHQLNAQKEEKGIWAE